VPRPAERLTFFQQPRVSHFHQTATTAAAPGPAPAARSRRRACTSSRWCSFDRRTSAAWRLTVSLGRHRRGGYALSSGLPLSNARGASQGAARRRPHRAEPDRPGEKGAKRSLLTEGKGIPLGIADEGANRNDFKLSRQTLESIPIERPKPTKESAQNLCLDKGYDYDEVRELAVEFGFTAHIRSRGEEKKALAREAGFRARRWVVERTHSWLNRYRALLIRWSKKPENHLALLHLACALITWKKTMTAPLPG
jgi:putative transposase